MQDPLTGLSVDSSDFRQRASRLQLSEDPDTATAQTVAEMVKQIHAAASDPLVRSLSFNAVRTIRGGPLWVGSGVQPFANPRVMAESCWWWCKHYLRFKHHGSMFEVWSSDLGDPRTKLQLLISPDVLVRMRKLEGDCAVYTMMLAAMLESLGLQWEICTGAVNWREPEIFSHVWPRVILPDGGREPLDASHGKQPGWQVPDHDIYRLKVWNKQGAEVANQARRFSGLHAYRTPRSRRGMGALVCLDPNDSSSCYEDSGTPATPPPDTTVNLCALYPGNCGTATMPTGVTVPTYTAPSPSNSAQWASFANQLMKSGLTLAEINAIQPGTVVSANGAILRQATGLPVPVGPSSLTTAFGSGSTSTLMLAGLGLLALLAFSSMGHK